MSSKTNKDVNNDSFIDEESSLCEEEVNYNNGRWSRGGATDVLLRRRAG